MALFDRVPDCRFVCASSWSVVGVGHDYEDDLCKVQKCPDIPGDRCYGLFAKQDIPAEQPLGEYVGTILNRQQSEQLCECKRVYLFQVSETRFIDASDPLHSSVIRYINHPSEGGQANATFVKRSVKGLGVRWRIYAVTTRPVKAGEQLLCVYDETPGDHDPVVSMSKSDTRRNLRKRTAEVARLRDRLADSLEALKEQKAATTYWKKQCSGIGTRVTRDERQRCWEQVRSMLPQVTPRKVLKSTSSSDGSIQTEDALQQHHSRCERPPQGADRNSDSSEATS